MNTFLFSFPPALSFGLPLATSITATPGLVRQSAESQLSLLMKVSERMVNATMQINELNRTASQKLVEESVADMQKVMRVRTLSDAQLLFGEQAQMSVERIRGYLQNLQNIAAQNMAVMAQPLAAAATGTDAAPDDESGQIAEAKVAHSDTPPEKGRNASAAGVKHPHEVDVQPSPLVEKMVASVAAETPPTESRS